jgi:hypothetical protein
MTVSRSKYVVCSPWDAGPFDLDIFTWQDKPDGYFFNYWVRIFKEFEKMLVAERAHFLFDIQSYSR